MAVAKCPECGTVIDLEEDEVEEGKTLTCPECAVELEIVNTHPLEFDIIEEEEEEDEESGDEDEDVGEFDEDGDFEEEN